jgi:hypothetical protein
MDNIRSSSPQPPASRHEPVLRPQPSREKMDQLPDWYRKLMASNPESDHWIHTLASRSNFMIERDPQHSNPVTEHTIPYTVTQSQSGITYIVIQSRSIILYIVTLPRNTIPYTAIQSQSTILYIVTQSQSNGPFLAAPSLNTGVPSNPSRKKKLSNETDRVQIQVQVHLVQKPGM